MAHLSLGINVIYLIVMLILLLVPQFHFISTNILPSCDFPTRLQGIWFQNDVGVIHIVENNMTTKGVCLERWNNDYLVHKRDLNCVMCIRMWERDSNVIQYEESFCRGHDTLNNTCATLRRDSILQTMVKVSDVTFSMCPFHDAYHFSYNNNSGGFCRDPSSYVKTCAGPSLFRFNFRHCSDAAYTYDKEMDFECLGNWTHDNNDYLFGKIKNVENDYEYRCFNYQKLGTVVYLSMSADTSCRGIRSARDGPLIMELTKDVFGWPQPSCFFPPWVTRYTWRDLSSVGYYVSNRVGSELNVMSDMTVARISQAYRCVKSTIPISAPGNVDGVENIFIANSFTSDGCESRHQCVKFVKRENAVTELYRGDTLAYDTDVCQESHFSNPVKKLLIPAPSSATGCPLQGVFDLHDEASNCRGTLHFGCNGTSSLDVDMPCEHYKRVQMRCIHLFGNNRKRFIVATRISNVNGPANCFILKRKEDKYLFATDKNCNVGMTSFFGVSIRYMMTTTPRQCQLPISTTQTAAHLLSPGKLPDNPMATSGGGNEKRKAMSRHVQLDDNEPHSITVRNCASHVKQYYLSLFTVLVIVILSSTPT